MTPKEKAKELIEKFKVYSSMYHDGVAENAKKCALILVDEVIQELRQFSPATKDYINWWKEVRREIDN